MSLSRTCSATGSLRRRWPRDESTLTSGNWPGCLFGKSPSCAEFSSYFGYEGEQSPWGVRLLFLALALHSGCEGRKSLQLGRRTSAVDWRANRFQDLHSTTGVYLRKCRQRLHSQRTKVDMLAQCNPQVFAITCDVDLDEKVNVHLQTADCCTKCRILTQAALLVALGKEKLSRRALPSTCSRLRAGRELAPGPAYWCSTGPFLCLPVAGTRFPSSEILGLWKAVDSDASATGF